MDTRNWELIYARAGHPAPLVISKDGDVLELDKGELPIGMFDDSNYEDYSYYLKSGDKLILYTDGITEIRSKGYAGKQDFIKLLLKHQQIEIEQTLKNVIADALSNQLGVQEDDIALLALKIN